MLLRKKKANRQSDRQANKSRGLGRIGGPKTKKWPDRKSQQRGLNKGWGAKANTQINQA